LRRAVGLALIAAAAAASPAASISLLIAALASLSTVLDPEVLEELFLADFAIARLPCSAVKGTNGRNGSLMMGECMARHENVKGTAALTQRCPSTWSAAEGDGRSVGSRVEEHPFPTSLLNHETSDHLLSLR